MAIQHCSRKQLKQGARSVDQATNFNYVTLTRSAVHYSNIRIRYEMKQTGLLIIGVRAFIIAIQIHQSSRLHYKRVG